MISSIKIDNKKKDILIFVKGPVHGLEQALSAEKKRIKKYVSVCIIMEQTVIYLLMVQKFINLKQKILKL